VGTESGPDFYTASTHTKLYACISDAIISANQIPIYERAGSSVRLHGLRHSHASHLLAENVHPKIVQERLGHYSIAITMDIYSHLMPNMQADAAAKVDAALRAAKKPSK
jgi:integrase